jgi:hypothetical protein
MLLAIACIFCAGGGQLPQLGIKKWRITILPASKSAKRSTELPLQSFPLNCIPVVWALEIVKTNIKAMDKKIDFVMIIFF